jgi:hypothetical protein
VDRAEPDFRKLGFSHLRKGWKLRILRTLGKPYNYNPLSLLRARLFPKRYRDALRIYDKTVKPRDLARWRERIARLREEP